MTTARDQFTKERLVQIPADADGKSLDGDGVLADIVASGMLETPCVVRNHVWGRFNDFMQMLDQGDPQQRYEAAVKLAGIALRYAWENRPR
jgi:hypothetical protein